MQLKTQSPELAGSLAKWLFYLSICLFVYRVLAQTLEASETINPLREPGLPHKQIVQVSFQLVGMGTEGVALREEKGNEYERKPWDLGQSILCEGPEGA